MQPRLQDGNPPSQASPRPPQELAGVYRNVVRVESRSTGHSFAVGSGVYLGDGYVATAKHVIESNAIRVTFSDGHTSVAKLIHRGTMDIALVQMDTPHPTLSGAPVRSLMDPIFGETLYSVGFGSNNRARWNTGRVCGMNSGGFDIAGISRQGDSGGPVFDRHGRVVGILWGTDRVARTVLTPIRRLKAFFGRFKCKPPRRVVQAPQPQPPPQPPTTAPVVDPPTTTPPTITDEQLRQITVAVTASVIAYVKDNPETFRGPTGATGAPGRDGRDADPVAPIDIDAIVERLPPVVVQVIDKDGKVAQRQSKPLGQPIRFQFKPVGK